MGILGKALQALKSKVLRAFFDGARSNMTLCPFHFLAKCRPDVTSLVSPESYHIAGLNSALFPSILQVLLELMFYSRYQQSQIYPLSPTFHSPYRKFSDKPPGAYLQK